MHIDRDRLRSVILLACTVGFAALGQLYLIRRREFVWDGVLFFGIALVCFARLTLGVARTIRPRPTGGAPGAQALGRRLPGRRQTILIGSALMSNLIAARSANSLPPPNDFTLSVLLWLASLVLFFAAFAPVPRLLQHPRQRTGEILRTLRNTPDEKGRLRRVSIDVALVLSLILAGLFLRAWDLEHIPANLSGDEGTQGMWARDALEGRLRNPFATGWFTVPNMSFFAQAISLQLFGDTIAGLRTPSALVGTAALVFTYLLARRTLGRQMALFALAALTFNHYHIHFSRLGSNQIADSLFAALTFWLLFEGLRRTRGRKHKAMRDARPWFLVAGLTIGLGWYGYFGSRLIGPLVAIFLGTQAIAERGFLHRHARELALLTLMALLVVTPLFFHYWSFPENLNARFNQVGFFRWLQNELSHPDHDSVATLVTRQVWRSISAFNFTLDPTFWYRPQLPLLDFVSGILFLLGLLVAITKWRQPKARLILLWFGLAILSGWVLTENPPSSMRLLIITPALALLVALGLDRLLLLARWVVGGRRAQWNQIGVVLMALAAVLNVHYYFVVYTPSRIYGNPTAETTTVLARHLQERWTPGKHPLELVGAEAAGAQPFVYFYGPPFLYFDFGTIQFIARSVRGVNVPPRDKDPDFPTPIVEPTLFVVLQERLDELEVIQSQHPRGTQQVFHSDADERLMFVVYDVSP